MMTLYPRLRTTEARPLIEAALSAPLEELEADRPVLPRGVVWAPTGGERVTEARLVELRGLLRQTARSVGYAPGVMLEPRAPEGVALDRALARVLFVGLGLSAHEASNGDVWRYFGCVLAPELVRWRFPGKEGSAQERFGSSIRRNLFARMWWRAYTFHDPKATDPWALLDALGEDEMVQITERPNAAGYRPLARGLARRLLKNHQEAPALNRGNLLRDTMKRLLRRLPLLRYEALNDAEMDEALDELYGDSLRAAGVVVRQVALLPAVPRSAPLTEPAPARDRAWLSTGLRQRRRLLRALDAAEVTALARALAPNDPLEPDPRWALLRGIRASVGEVVAALPSASGVASRLDVRELRGWLESSAASSWVADAVPERAVAVLRLLDPEWLTRWFTLVAGEQLDAVGVDAPRAVMRQFDGEWQALLGHLSAETCATMLTMVAPGALVGEDARSALGSWLLGRPVVAPFRGELPEPDPLTSEEAGDIRAGAPDVAVSAPAGSGAEGAAGSPPMLDTALPPPPGLIRNLVARLGLRTHADLRSVDLAMVQDMAGVGTTKVECIREWRIALLGPEPEPPPPPPRVIPVLPSLIASLEVHPVPRLVEGLLNELGVVTYGDLVALDLDELKERERVGPKRLALLESMRSAALEGALGGGAERPTFPDLAALESAVLERVQGRDLRLLTRRLLEGGSLLECGQEMGLSRERARQILREIVERSRREYGHAAAELLRSECSVDATADRAFHRQMATFATVGFDRLRLPLTLAADDWSLVDEHWFVRGGGAEFDRLLADVDQWIAGRTEIELDALVGAPVPAGVLEVILMELRGMRVEGDRWVVDTSRVDKGEALVERLRAVGTAHQDELATWLIGRDGGSLDPEEVFRVARSVEGLLSRQPLAWRTAMGTFTHRDALPVSEAALGRLVELAVNRIRGLPGAISTRSLLSALSATDEAAARVSPWLLKDAMSRHPEVKPLRKSLVAFAGTFSEEGVHLTDRVEAILREAGVPLSLDDIADRLPDGLDYSRNAVYGVLLNGGIAASAGRGRFIWAPAASDATGET